MSNILDRYVIHFKGLKVGLHQFDFDVDKAFFDEFEGNEISDGRVEVAINLQRHSTMLELEFEIDGEVEVPCDHCLDRFFLPISFEGKLFVRITDSIPEDNDNDEVWFVSSNEHDINLAQYIYESICLSLPIQRYHGVLGTSSADCDQDMLEKLRLLSLQSDNKEDGLKPDSPWDKLKDLKN